MSLHLSRLAQCALVLVTSLLLTACGGGSTVTIDPPGDAVSTRSPRPLSSEYATRKAVNYSPFRSGNRDTEVITAAMVKEDLELLLKGNFRLIRLFDSSERVARLTLQVIRDNNLDIKVQLGAFVLSDKFAIEAEKPNIAAFNRAELERAVVLANEFRSTVLAVSVGNETMVSWSTNPITPTAMAGFLSTVRSQITQPVTSDDNWLFYASVPTVIAENIDFVSMHTYSELDSVFDPTKFDWRQVGVATALNADGFPARAAAMMQAAMDVTKLDFQRVRDKLDRLGLSAMPIAVGETGWNAVDVGKLAFRAHPVNQKMYFDALTAWRAQAQGGAGPINIFYFEAFDEPWKLGDDKWGLFNVQRQARLVIQPLGTCGTTWACEPGSFTNADAVFFTPPVVNAAITASKFTLFSDAAPVANELRPTGLRWDAFDGNSVLARDVSSTSAPGDGGISIEITPQPKDFGWGFLNQSAMVPPTTVNLSGFASGSVHFSIKTTYPGKIEIGISSDTQDRDAQEAYLQIGNGDFGYCNTGVWCEVTIPLSAFAAANPKLDLSLVLSRFIIADRFAFTGKPANSNITTQLNIDGIFWAK